MIPLAVLTEIPEALKLVATITPKIQAGIPLVEKLFADVKQAIADKTDPTKMITDLEIILKDMTADFNALVAYFPPTPAEPAPAAPAQ